MFDGADIPFTLGKIRFILPLLAQALLLNANAESRAAS